MFVYPIDLTMNTTAIADTGPSTLSIHNRQNAWSPSAWTAASKANNNLNAPSYYAPIDYYGARPFRNACAYWPNFSSGIGGLCKDYHIVTAGWNQAERAGFRD